ENPNKRPLCEEIHKELQSFLDDQIGRILDLSDHNIGDNGIAMLAKALRSNSSSISLNNKYKETGNTKAASRAKAAISSLTSLSRVPSINQMGDAGTISLT